MSWHQQKLVIGSIVTVLEFLIRYSILEISLLLMTPEGIKVSSVINCYHFTHRGMKELNIIKNRWIRNKSICYKNNQVP